MRNEDRKPRYSFRSRRIATIGLSVVLPLALGFAGGRLTAPPAENRNSSDGLAGVPPKRKPYTDHKIAPGDVLGIYIRFIFGEKNQSPKVFLPKEEGENFALGNPITVNQNGEIVLPYTEPFQVAGLTANEVHSLIRKRYLEQDVLKAGSDRIVVSVIRPYDGGK